MKNAMIKLHLKSMNTMGAIKKEFVNTITTKKGEGHVETAIKVLIAVVVGAVILVASYSMFKDTLIPKLQQKLMEMFNYSG